MQKSISKKKGIALIEAELNRGLVEPNLILQNLADNYKNVKTFYNHFKTAFEIFTKERQELQKKIEPQLIKKQAELIKAEIDAKITNIVTRTERMEIASRIARGHARKIGNELIIPTGAEQLKALDYLSKIDGDYAPEKIDVTQREIRPIEFIVINAENAKTIDTD